MELQNSSDLFFFKENKLKKEEISPFSLDALVDTGAVSLFLPEDVVKKLGLQIIGDITVQYADERKEQRKMAGAVLVKILNRSMTTDCIVGPPNSEALIGQIVLEALDLIPDPRRKKLYPRPEAPIYSLIKMK